MASRHSGIAAKAVPIAVGLLMVAATTGPSVVASAAKKAPTITLQFWNAYNETDSEAKTMANVVIPAFEKSHPGIKVVSDVFPYSTLQTKLFASVLAGKPPDVVRSDIIWLPELAAEGALTPLSTAMPGFKQLAAEVYPGPLKTNYWQGVYYGLPLDTNTQALFWNKTDFKAAGLSGPPTNMNQFLTDVKKLTVKAKHQYGLGIDGQDMWNVGPYLWSMGGSFTNPAYTKATGYMNGATTVKALTTLVNLYKAGDVGSDFLGGTGTISGEQGFPTGQYAMYIDGPWGASTYQQKYPKLQYGIAQLPAGAGGSRSVVGGEDVIVPRNSKHVAAAEEFTTFLLSPLSQEAMAKAGQMSVLKTAGTFETKIAPYYAPFAQQLLHALPRPPVPKYGEIDADWITGLQEILQKGQPVQSTLTQVAAQADGLLAQK